MTHLPSDPSQSKSETTVDTYVCSMCKGEFEKGWSEEEALEELDELWGVPQEDCDIVCDDCFKLIMGEV